MEEKNNILPTEKKKNNADKNVEERLGARARQIQAARPLNKDVEREWARRKVFERHLHQQHG